MKLSLSRTKTGNRRKGQKVLSLYSSIQKRRGRRYTAQRFRHFLLVSSVALFIVSFLIILGKWTLNWVFFENPRYALSRVEVEVHGRLKKDQVLVWADIPAEANVLALDLRAIQTRLESQSAIQTAEVKRQLPDRLTIRVTERRPLARIVLKKLLDGSEDFYYTIDQEGLIMRPRVGEDFSHLPEIRGLDSEKIVSGERLELGEVYSAIFLLSLMERMLGRTDFHLQSIDVSKATYLVVDLVGGGRVRFSASSSELKFQLERFEKILNYCEETNRKLSHADLTVQRNVPVTFFPLES